MKYAKLPFVLMILCGLPSVAFAGDSKLRGETFCYPAKDVPKIVKELAQVKAKRRNIVDVASTRPDTDICIDDPTRADRPEDDEGLYFEMGLAPLFKTTTGEHSVAELEEAATDAKKFYKKMLPDVVSIFMPDTDYFAIKMVDPKAVPTVFASLAASETQLSLEAVDDMWVVSLDDILEAEAEGLSVRGGAYDLQPVPSPKTLRKFVVRDTSRSRFGCS